MPYIVIVDETPILHLLQSIVSLLGWTLATNGEEALALVSQMTQGNRILIFQIWATWR